MVEHGIPYVDCEHSGHHVPIYSRAMAVDPETLQPLKTAKRGCFIL